jgi:hypothetical protein
MIIKINSSFSFFFSFIKVNVLFYNKAEQLSFFFVSSTTMGDDSQAIAIGLGAGLGGFVGLVCFDFY